MAKITMEEAWKALNYVGAQIEERNAARALALVVHDDACLTCTVTLLNPSPDFIAGVTLRRDKCKERKRIEALGR